MNNIQSIMSLNVHNFFNSEMIETDLKTYKIIKNYDIIALQEVYNMEILNRISFEYNYIYDKGNVIMTKYPIQLIKCNTTFPCNISLITLPSNIKIFVINVHLNYQDEKKRIEEMKEIEQVLDNYTRFYPSILLGDFNSLTRDDYNKKEWTNIAKIRKYGNWELPVHILTDNLLKSWQDSGHKNKIPTSRYNTRIDYIYTKRINYVFYDIIQTIHTLSDHNLVSIFFKV